MIPEYIVFLGLIYNINIVKLFNFQHCEKFSGTTGPTKAIFDKIEDKIEYSTLTLKDVLSILVDLEQHDILQRVSWQDGISKELLICVQLRFSK